MTSSTDIFLTAGWIVIVGIWSTLGYAFGRAKGHAEGWDEGRKEAGKATSEMLSSAMPQDYVAVGVVRVIMCTNPPDTEVQTK